MFEYVIYGKYVRSNVLLKHALKKESQESIEPIINLEVIISNYICNNLKYGIKIEGDLINICYEEIIYHIEWKSNVIRVETKIIDWLERTFYNLPFSIYCLLNGEMILHCSSVIFENKLYAFVGNKGMGKSTLALKLHIYQNMEIVTDDSMLITANKTFIPYNKCKIKEEVIDEIEEIDRYLFNNIKFDNMLNKYWISVNSNKLFHNNKLDTIYILKRSGGKRYLKKEIKSTYVKKILLINNIVGIKRMPIEIKRMLVFLKIDEIVQKINMYELIVPEETFKESKINELKL